MRLLPDSRKFIGSLGLLLLLNLVIKPVWVLGIDRQVQNITGYEVYGQYFGLFSLALVFQFLMDLGITAFVNRSVAVDPSKGPALLSQAISMKFVLSLLHIGGIVNCLVHQCLYCTLTLAAHPSSGAQRFSNGVTGLPFCITAFCTGCMGIRDR